MSLQGTDLALVSARIGVARIGAFRLGFCPEDVEGVGTVGPGEYAWREIEPEDDGEEWHVVAAWSMCAEKCVASFTAVPSPAYVGQTVQFTDTSTPAAEITFWHWHFGDGAESDLQNPTHVYTHAGVYTVTLWTSSPRGACSATATITIEVPAPLVVTIIADPAAGYSFLDVNFTSVVTGGVAPYVYAWDFGDGTTEGDVPATLKTFDWNHVDNPTTWVTTLTVTDSFGTVAQDTQNILVSHGA